MNSEKCLKELLNGMGCTQVEKVVELSPAEFKKIGKKIRESIPLSIVGADTIILTVLKNVKGREQD